MKKGGVNFICKKGVKFVDNQHLAFAPADYQKHINITGEVVRISPQGIGVKFKMAKHQQETANRKGLGERRKQKRFRLHVDTFALLNRPFCQTAEIIDSRPEQSSLMERR